MSNIVEKLQVHLKDALNAEGDIIDFRVYDGSLFTYLLHGSKHTNKKCYGIDTFTGLCDPTLHDKRDPDINRVKKGQFLANEILVKQKFQPASNHIIAKTLKYDDLERVIPFETKFCFALIDLKQYATTKKALDYIWDRISYGGTIFLTNYDENQNHSEHVAIKEFLTEYAKNISITRQMIIDGRKEKCVAIKCFNERIRPNNWKNYIFPPKRVSIAMVLKTGGEVYDHNYVNALARSIKRHVTIDHEVVCLTDNPIGISSNVDRIIPLSNNYPTWWSKIELFKPHQFSNPVFYFDLDTLIIGNIDHIVNYDGIFSGLRDFYGLHSLGSGIMAWNPAHTSKIYNNFVTQSKLIMSNYREGDQRWIDENKPLIEYIQDIHPNEIVSYKRHCLDNSGLIKIPPEAKIICFHGNPRPHTVKHPDISRHWQP